MNRETWECPQCGQGHEAVRLERGQAARCVACREILRLPASRGPLLGMMWTLTALGLFLSAALLPLMDVSKAGLAQSASLVVVSTGLSESGMPFLALLAGALVVWIPLLAMVALFMLNLGTLRGAAFPGWRLVLRMLRFAKQWSMPEVFLLAVLVALLKIGDLAETALRPGLAFLAGATLCLLMAFRQMERDQLGTRLGPQGSPQHAASLQAVLAFMAAALILLVPANLLPIMVVRMGSEEHASTILGGIRQLIEHGSWGIALIVFVASLLVPFAKIGGLGWLIWHSRRPSQHPLAPRLHQVVEFIGRWSMLDIFLVALLAGLIRFGPFAEIRPGPAAPAFAGAVVLTLLAVEHFDVRRLRTPQTRIPVSS